MKQSAQESRVAMQYPRIFIDDNGMILKNASPAKLMGSQMDSERLMANSEQQSSYSPRKSGELSPSQSRTKKGETSPARISVR